MALVLKKLYSAYNILFEELSDPRTASWPLMSSPFPTLAILVFYLYFVKKLGPALMLYRNPLNPKGIMIVYNIIQILVCSYIFVMSLALGWATTYQWFCEPVDYTINKKSIEVAKLVYVYFVVKLMDLMDTVFFVLRKKQSHVSFLHVYHHTGMVMLVWSCCKFLPGGHATSLGVLNSFVHVVMYSYYLLCLISEKYRTSIWWKKHITQLQILQFFLLAIHFTSLLVIKDCAYPRWVAGVMVPQNMFMMILFVDFYIKAYIKKSDKTVHQNGVEEEHKQNGVEGKLQNGFHKHSVSESDKNE